MIGQMSYNPANVGIGDTLWVQSHRGWHKYTATAYQVERKTPSGQVVAVAGARQIRINPRGRVLGDDRMWLVDEQTAREIQAECREDALWSVISGAADGLTHATRQRDPALIRAALAKVADNLDKLPTHSEAEV